jgi:hypothetical protein
LKIARETGNKGRVFAVDLLREPLAFLWIRAFLQRRTSLHIIYADAENDHLPDDLGRLPEGSTVLAAALLIAGLVTVPIEQGCPQASHRFYAALVISSDPACCGKHCETSTFLDIDRLAEHASIRLADSGVCHRIDWIRSTD